MSLCFDFIRNGNETDVDCGGHCWKRCDLGEACRVSLDCQTGLCSEGECVSNIVRALGASGAAPSPKPEASYVHMPYEELNTAILFILLLFVIPCCLVITFLFYRIHQNGGTKINLESERDPTEIQLIPKSPSIRDQIIEESI